MDEQERLKLVKTAMGISGQYQDELLKIYIADAKNTLQSAGVSQRIADSKEAIGAIVRYVIDAWSYEAGAAKMSPLFIAQVVQLRSKGGKESE